MSISGRHRSPLLREIPDFPKDFYSFQSAAQPGGALFCLPPSKVIYQLYPTANVFCAIDISVIFSSGTSLLHPRRWDTLCFFSGAGCKCLQNYCKFRCSFHPASPFSMQSVEVYMLHSFSSQVYSFQRRRQFLRENKSNICMFLSCITVNCIFLFSVAFVIIIVYKGDMCRPPT